MTPNKQYTEQHKNFGRVWAVPRLCGFCPGICLTTEEKAWKNLSQGSQRVPAGTMKVHKHTIRIHRHNNKKTIKIHKLQYYTETQPYMQIGIQPYKQLAI